MGKYEFVYCIGKTEEKDKVGGDEEYWYKIRNCDNKEGWVFGKYIQYIDGTKEPDKYYKQMIENEIIKRLYCSYGNKVKIYKLCYENHHYIIDFENKEKVKLADMYNEISVGLLIFYRMIDGIFNRAIENMGRRNYLFYKDYIFIYTLKGIDVYNTKKYREKRGEPHFNIPYKYYDCTGFYLDDILKNYEGYAGKELYWYSYSDMEFNPETLEVTVNIRKEKVKLLKQEKYKIKDGNFLKVE